MTHETRDPGPRSDPEHSPPYFTASGNFPAPFLHSGKTPTGPTPSPSPSLCHLSRLPKLAVRPATSLVPTAIRLVRDHRCLEALLASNIPANYCNSESIPANIDFRPPNQFPQFCFTGLPAISDSSGEESRTRGIMAILGRVQAGGEQFALPIAFHLAIDRRTAPNTIALALAFAIGFAFAFVEKSANSLRQRSYDR
ncbi:hypothetical protein LXL04_010014 [Taraxacum kok-saghyz]